MCKWFQNLRHIGLKKKKKKQKKNPGAFGPENPKGDSDFQGK
jgi:hypothetical protein